MPLWIYDSAAVRKAIQKLWIYDSAANRKAIQKMWIYDENANRKLIFSGGASAANFQLNNAASIMDDSEGSMFGVGWGQFGSSNNDGAASTTPVGPPAVGGVGSARCLFTTAGNSGDVGLPQNQIIYGVTNQSVPNTDASFVSMFVAGIGTFSRASATYYANGANSQGSEWRWTYAGPYFNLGASHVVQFT